MEDQLRWATSAWRLPGNVSTAGTANGLPLLSVVRDGGLWLRVILFDSHYF
ncbi:hypothetical protein M427DRAFT_56796 [Gonapodya prolifera JEL478]|uniref:Uncharacterized protein n=1 Tax=Gonapodya prolifera (strain JEL478) TaxID=1344416 RepID=A0A139AG93_GONPJ|nr:hypothetical protein M427DRAFT_56796 [Gonapodya prolifera JEL478]|eukprot:KXS15455.1 hypothetical protein M427DRAFT_56796 [Gonapodya prolifera JEL478]